MGNLVFVLGKPGTGKSFSLRNFSPEELGVLNVQGKILPFKGSGKFEIINTDDSDEITAGIKKLSKKYKSIVVDDFQYVMANEYMRRSSERGYDKFTDIGRHAWDIANCVRDLPIDVIVYILCHTDTDADGLERLKTIGKLLDEKIFLEGMSTIVLITSVADGKYTFLTQNNGKNTVKSPYGMFPTYAIDNDLHYVDQKIRSFYQIGDYKTDEEMTEADAAVAHEEIKKEEPKRKRGKKKEEEPEETSQEVEKEETAGEDDPYAGAKEPFERARRKVAAEKAAEKEKPAPGSRSRRISKTLKEEREKVAAENLEKLVNVPEGEDEEAPFDAMPAPELAPMPRRKKRTVEEPAEAPEPAAEAPVRRRGRRRV